MRLQDLFENHTERSETTAKSVRIRGKMNGKIVSKNDYAAEKVMSENAKKKTLSSPEK